MVCSERVIWVDWAKTICLFLMVVGHTYPNYDIVSQFIYSFHMPAFFIISGFLYRPKPIIKTLISFFIPIALFSVLDCFFEYMLYGKDILKQVVFFELQMGKGVNVFTGLWFIQVLVASRFILGDFLNKNTPMFIAISFAIICSVLSVLLPQYTDIGKSFYLYRLFPSFPFLVTGLFLKKYYFIIQKYLDKVFVVVCAFLASVLLCLINGRCDIYGLVFGRSYILFFINALLATFVLISVCRKFGKSPIIKDFSSGTLLVLGVHFNLNIIICNLLPNCMSGLIFVIVPIVSMFVCYPFIYLFHNYCPWVLGKMPKKKTYA